MGLGCAAIIHFISPPMSYSTIIIKLKIPIIFPHLFKLSGHTIILFNLCAMKLKDAFVKSG